MSVVSGKLVQSKISAGSVGEFGVSLRTFIPAFQVCPARSAYDYAGREAPEDSIDTQTCPGAYPASLRIEVENSLRPFISPTYFNLPVGIGGTADTMFGMQSTSRVGAFGYNQNLEIPVYAGQKNANSDLGAADLSNMAQKFTGNIVSPVTPSGGEMSAPTPEGFRFVRRHGGGQY